MHLKAQTPRIIKAFLSQKNDAEGIIISFGFKSITQNHGNKNSKQKAQR